jgi:2Fe-2S ferredoxin
LTTTPGHPLVRVEPGGFDLEVDPGETIIEAAWRLGFSWPTACYAQATCTSCFVEVLDGEQHLSPVGEEERDALDHRFSGRARVDMTRIRLACRARPRGEVRVRKPGVSPPVSAP